MSDPLSAYDFVYKAMTEDERNSLQKSITNIMVASTDVAVASMKKAMENALSDIVIAPMREAVRENASNDEWVYAISEALWKNLLKSKPDDLLPYRISTLIDAWRENYPEHFKAVMEGELLKQNQSLEERLQFYINLRNG